MVGQGMSGDDVLSLFGAEGLKGPPHSILMGMFSGKSQTPLDSPYLSDSATVGGAAGHRVKKEKDNILSSRSEVVRSEGRGCRDRRSCNERGIVMNPTPLHGVLQDSRVSSVLSL